MPYIGLKPETVFRKLSKQTITGNGGTAYTLSYPVNNSSEIEVYVNNVRQEPDVAYTAISTTLTMTDNVLVTDSFYVVYQGQSIGTLSIPEKDNSSNYNFDNGLLYLDAGNNYVGIGTTTPSDKFQIASIDGNADFSGRVDSATASHRPSFRFIHTGGSLTTQTPSDARLGLVSFAGINDAGSLTTYSFFDSYLQGAANSNANSYMRFYTTSLGSAAERMRIGSDGNVGIGTSSPNAKLEILGATVGAEVSRIEGNYSASGSVVLTNWRRNGGAVAAIMRYNDATTAMEFGTSTSHAQTFITGGTERMRIDSTGYVNIGTTTNIAEGSGTNDGATLYGSLGILGLSANGDRSLFIKRRTSDGTLVNFLRDNTIQGSISIAGTTTTYGAFSGSHWSQLSDNSRPDILVGTVVETIDEKCVWPGQDNDQLVKFKISNTPASKRVYGVFMSWDNDDDENNDAYITSLGAYLIRIAAGHNVEGGDLLESNGDGCARVQADDIIRSSTIGKVTSNIPTHTYEDGSYTVPCVLYCG